MLERLKHSDKVFNYLYKGCAVSLIIRLNNLMHFFAIKDKLNHEEEFSADILFHEKNQRLLLNLLICAIKKHA